MEKVYRRAAYIIIVAGYMVLAAVIFAMFFLQEERKKKTVRKPVVQNTRPRVVPNKPVREVEPASCIDFGLDSNCRPKKTRQRVVKEVVAKRMVT